MSKPSLRCSRAGGFGEGCFGGLLSVDRINPTLATRVRQIDPQVIYYMQFTHAKLALQRVGGGRRQAYRREELLLFRCHGR